MTPEEKENLRRLALAATPGDWRNGRKVGRTLYADEKLMGMLDRVEDAAFVCAASPQVVLALLDEVATPNPLLAQSLKAKKP